MLFDFFINNTYPLQLRLDVQLGQFLEDCAENIHTSLHEKRWNFEQ